MATINENSVLKDVWLQCSNFTPVGQSIQNGFILKPARFMELLIHNWH